MEAVEEQEKGGLVALACQVQHGFHFNVRIRSHLGSDALVVYRTQPVKLPAVHLFYWDTALGGQLQDCGHRAAFPHSFGQEQALAAPAPSSQGFMHGVTAVKYF